MSDDFQTQELVAPDALSTYPKREDLIVLDGWKPPALGPVLAQMKLEVLGLLEVAAMAKEVTTQEHADELAKTIGVSRRFIDDVEAISKALREPYFTHSRLIKALTDSLNGEILLKQDPCHKLLGEFESRKQLVKERLERQAEEEAKAKREEAAAQLAQNEQARQASEVQEQEQIEQLKAEVENAKGKAKRTEAMAKLTEAMGNAAKAATERKAEQESEHQQLASIAPVPISYAPAKTAGVNSNVGLSWDVVDERKFAEWIWANNRGEWIREIQFNKRSITEWIEAQKLPNPTDVPIIPGLSIQRTLAVNVAKAPKSKKPINVATQRVPLDTPAAQPDDWIETPRSSQIKRIGYDSKQQILKIVFQNDTIYDYFQVPAGVFEGFRTAPSAGIYFGKTVKGVFAFKKRL